MIIILTDVLSKKCFYYQQRAETRRCCVIIIIVLICNCKRVTPFPRPRLLITKSQAGYNAVGGNLILHTDHLYESFERLIIGVSNKHCFNVSFQQ